MLSFRILMQYFFFLFVRFRKSYVSCVLLHHKQKQLYFMKDFCFRFLFPDTARSKSLSQIKEQLLNEELIRETEKSRRSQSESKMHIPETNENRKQEIEYRNLKIKIIMQQSQHLSRTQDCHRITSTIRNYIVLLMFLRF